MVTACTSCRPLFGRIRACASALSGTSPVGLDWPSVLYSKHKHYSSPVVSTRNRQHCHLNLWGLVLRLYHARFAASRCALWSLGLCSSLQEGGAASYLKSFRESPPQFASVPHPPPPPRGNTGVSSFCWLNCACIWHVSQRKSNRAQNKSMKSVGRRQPGARAKGQVQSYMHRPRGPRRTPGRLFEMIRLPARPGRNKASF